MSNIRVYRLPATPILMLVLNNSSIEFTVEGKSAQQNIDIYTNNADRFNKDVDVKQNIGVTALAVLVSKNPKLNIIQNHGIIQGQCIGDHQSITQYFDGNIMHQSVTSDIKVTIVVPENIDVSVYNGINVNIKGVKGKVENQCH